MITTPFYVTMWQPVQAPELTDLMDYLLSLKLTPKQLARGKDYLDPPLEKICSVGDCARTRFVGDLCSSHHWQWTRWGTKN